MPSLCKVCRCPSQCRIAHGREFLELEFFYLSVSTLMIFSLLSSSV
jgi:hypothetical protein